jgi:hypothetical protein
MTLDTLLGVHFGILVDGIGVLYAAPTPVNAIMDAGKTFASCKPDVRALQRQHL